MAENGEVTANGAAGKSHKFICAENPVRQITADVEALQHRESSQPVLHQHHGPWKPSLESSQAELLKRTHPRPYPFSIYSSV
jgi:hypothetical protein